MQVSETIETSDPVTEIASTGQTRTQAMQAVHLSLIENLRPTVTSPVT